MTQTVTSEERGRVASPSMTGPATIEIPITPLVHTPPAAGDPWHTGPTGYARAEEPEPGPRVVEGIEFTRDQVELIKRTIAVGATDDELELFLYTCKRLKLDPFARQIYFMKRGSGENKVGRAEISIDGFRLIAARTGLYRGQIEPEWADVYRNDDGSISIDWFQVWPFPDREPYAARLAVLRKGFERPLYAIARWIAYVQVTDVWEDGPHGRVKVVGKSRPNGMWIKRGPEQLAKCAESLALRQAFPNELSGVYTVDEMDQADNPEGAVVRDATPARRGARRDRRSARKPEPTPDAKKDTAATHATPAPAEPEVPLTITRYPLLFPFPPHKDVALDAHPDGALADAPDAPEYTIDADTLERVFRLAERALNGDPIAGKDGTRRPITDAERPKWELLRTSVEAELIRRIEERDEFLKQRAEGPDGAGVDEAAAADPTETADPTEGDIEEARRSVAVTEENVDEIPF